MNQEHLNTDTERGKLIIRCTEVITKALLEVGKVHDSFIALGDPANLTDKSDDASGQILKLDWQAEEAIIETFKESQLPVRVFSEEHGVFDLVDQPELLVIMDGLDGSSLFRDRPGEARYASMVAVFDGLKPNYNDYLSSGILELSPNKKLYIAEKDRGTWIEEVGGVYFNFDDFALSTPDKYYVGLEKHFPEELRDKEFPLSERFDYRCEAMALMDVLTGEAKFIIEYTRKNNLEQMIAYGLVSEAGFSMLDINGEDLGGKSYSEFGRNDDIPQIIIIGREAEYQGLKDKLDALKRESEESGAIDVNPWGQQPAFIEEQETQVFNSLDLPLLTPADEAKQKELLETSFKLQISTLEDLLGANYAVAEKIIEVIGTLKSEHVNPWMSDRGTYEDDFSNIFDHQLAVATLAKSIAGILVEQGFLDESEVDEITFLAFLHDVNKKIEIQERIAIKKGILTGDKPSRYVSMTSEILIGAGIEYDIVVKVEDAGVLTSPSGINRFLKTSENEDLQLFNANLSELIVRIADDMVCSRKGSHFIMTPEERFIASGFLLKGSSPENYAPTALSPEGIIRFGVKNDEVEQGSVTGQALSFHIVSAEMIAGKICKLIEGKDVESPMEYLRDLVVKKLSQ